MGRRHTTLNNAPAAWGSSSALCDMRIDDPRHKVPPPAFGHENGPRKVPYILTQDEVARLMQEAVRYGTHPMQGATYSTLIGLLACTGLRISEALRLRYRDITPDGLLIHNTKFRKSRLVALHESARATLERYLSQRRAFAPLGEHVFVSLRGTAADPGVRGRRVP